MLAGLDVPFIFLSYGSVIPVSAFPPQGPFGCGSPVSSVLFRHSDSLCPSQLASFPCLSVPPVATNLRAYPGQFSKVSLEWQCRLSLCLETQSVSISQSSHVETAASPRFLGNPCLHALP
jgi:hypothetical protein